MVNQKPDTYEDFDLIAGNIQGAMIEMMRWLREHNYDSDHFLEAVARVWEEWAEENSLIFDRSIQ
jgi:hypothetical protein